MTPNSSDADVERRTVLRGVGSLAALGALAGCVADGDDPSASDGDGTGGADGAGGEKSTETATTDEAEHSHDEDGHDDNAETEKGAVGPLPEKLEAWLSDVDNYEEVTDKAGQDEVTITVGAEGNPRDVSDNPFAFAPPVVRIDPGTTVTWEWTGEGGAHHVVAEDESFQSDIIAHAGTTFQQTFDEPGAVLYHCRPHKALGMKGVLIVGSVEDIDTESLPGPHDDEVRIGWLADADNYDGGRPVNRRDEDEVTIGVGAEGNGGHLAFEPPAVSVSTGTTVVWDWTGEGGAHNVVEKDGEFSSGDPVAEAGTTFEQTFDDPGGRPYYCEPHRPVGMKGLVAVVPPNTTDPGEPDTPDEDTPTPNRNLDAPEEVQEYLVDVSNATSVTDKTGQEQVTVTVGAAGNGGPFAFSPAVLRIDAGTTVVWEWTGNGGHHTVTAQNFSFQSDIAAEGGTTFEQTFDSTGVVLYRCRPHEALGMKAAIIVE